jgi:mRNA interferase MazF
VIRGGVYQVDLGAARGHEQRGKRLGVLVSPSDLELSVVTIVPTSTSAQAAVFRPEIEVNNTVTRVLVDQIRSVDVNFVGDMVGYLTRDELLDVDHALRHYLGVLPIAD